MSADQASEKQILAPDVDLPDQLPWQTPEDLEKPALSIKQKVGLGIWIAALLGCLVDSLSSTPNNFITGESTPRWVTAMEDLYKSLPFGPDLSWWIIGSLSVVAAWFAIPWKNWTLSLVVLLTTASLLIFPLSYFAMYPPDSLAERIGWGLVTSTFWAGMTFTILAVAPYFLGFGLYHLVRRFTGRSSTRA